MRCQTPTGPVCQGHSARVPVDRRFNRSRYNAEAVVAGFTARMRQTVDFDAVRDDLVGVVHEAFQPTRVDVAR
jgi:hypothetical protein